MLPFLQCNPQLVLGKSASREFDSSHVCQNGDSILFVVSVSLITRGDSPKGSNVKYFSNLRMQEGDYSDFCKALNFDALNKNRNRT